MATNKTDMITKGGIYVALSIIILYLTVFIPFNTLFILGIASTIIPISILTIGFKPSIIVYISVSLLSYFLIPQKSIWLIYTIFFGIYGLIKFLIEGINKLYLELMLKFIYFNISCLLFYYISTILFISKNQILEILKINPSTILIFVVMYEIGFYIYDYALTFFISYIKDKILKHI
ncbi:hypothetical protein KQI36_06070 [Clostridium senegalense]|uniref:hypothetical protein n=1 Tax=Clostridium senegalense TaxID=1465809 RepID=UPI001C110C80|nr:hypothetical protein [Clostridium senegalense]MBU5226214.1 hypothetical protein [Clostridium senegalense]